MNDLFSWLCQYVGEYHTAEEWQDIVGITIIDPDGWRTGFSPSSFQLDKICLNNFIQRAAASTITNRKVEESVN